MNRYTRGEGQVVTFKKQELRGSRLRCLMLTTMPRTEVASVLTRLVEPIGTVDANRDKWAPEGFSRPDEPKVGEHSYFLSAAERELITNWWLKVRRNANTPNWDIVSTCDIGGNRGLLLVEAKAHSNELKCAGKEGNNAENDVQIANAINEANSGLNGCFPGWFLTKDSHYQLCNRFAWCWKLATMGIPTILVYLAFLHCDEMSDCGQPFDSAQSWASTIKEHSQEFVPTDAWGKAILTTGARMWAIACSLELKWHVAAYARGQRMIGLRSEG